MTALQSRTQRTTIRSQGNRVVLTSTTEDGLRTRREFMCPLNGGYVREVTARGDWSQVCRQLAHTGPTLECADEALFQALIRREYAAMRRAEASERSRW